jgi:multidrug efflux pump subunit AcrB
MLVGIVAKNGILLLEANQKYRAQGMEAEEAMIHAGRRRLRPIVMTALAAVARRGKEAPPRSSQNVKSR